MQRGVKVERRDVASNSPASSSSKKYLQFEHFAYLEKSIPSVTISARDSSLLTHRFQKYSVFDRTLKSPEDLRRNILIISEALVKVIYPFQDKSISFFSDSLVSLDFIRHMGLFLASNPRAPHLIQRDSPVSKEFYRLLSQNVNSIKRMGVTVKDLQFYEEKLGKIQAHFVTSKLIELYIFFGALAYLIGLYFLIQVRLLC